MKTRRNFLKMVGQTAVVTLPLAAVASTPEAPKDAAQAFRFQCMCGEEVVAPVPAEEGKKVQVSCTCGHPYSLTWKGTHFSFRDSWVRGNKVLREREEPDHAQEAVEKMKARIVDSYNKSRESWVAKGWVPPR